MSRATFFRALDPDTADKGAHLAERIAAARTQAEPGYDTFVRDPVSFGAIPKSPFAYWVSERIRRIFEEFPPLEGNAGTVKQGLATADDFRFVRAWWEVDPERIGCSAEDSEQGRGWIHFAKGGSYSPYYADLHLVVNWFDRGAEIRNFNRAYIRNEDFYFRPGASWPHRAPRLAPACLPAGMIFGHIAKSAFPTKHTSAETLLALLNSTPFGYLVRCGLPRLDADPQFEVGLVQSSPAPPVVKDQEVEETSKQLALLQRARFQTDETSHFFKGLILSRPGQGDVTTKGSQRRSTLDQLQRTVDNRLFASYQITDDDEIQQIYTDLPKMRWAKPERLTWLSATEAANVLSWIVGVANGRWNVRLAKEPSLIPPDPPLFAPLPRRSPAVLERRDDSMPTGVATSAPEMPDLGSYPVRIAQNGILVDDPGHPNDLVDNVRDIFRFLYGERAPEIAEEALATLQGGGRTPRSIRDWFRNQKATDLGQSFFDFHIRRYSKSRRKAPIYWRLCSSPGRGQSNYGVWLYYHRLTDDTLWKVLGEYVTPRRELEERRLREVREGLRGAEGSEARQLEEEIQEHTDFLEEITWFEEEIRKVAESGWAPNLDDGVIINMAPLHAVVPWKEPEKIWKRLQKGEYDWSHMAMRYWPERVQEKCRTDKSLAIAHDRLDLYEGD